MKKVIKIKQSDLKKMVKRNIKEQEEEPENIKKLYVTKGEDGTYYLVDDEGKPYLSGTL